MSHGYKAVGWNRQKKIYDATLWAAIAIYLGVFLGASIAFQPNAGVETLLIRALGTAALILLHIILSIGPMARFDQRWLPLLYNRRHMGVSMFLLALGHGVIALAWYHGFGNTGPLVSLFTSNLDFGSIADFPFQPLGFIALLILFLMAATSHDFWMANLTAPVWKALHMLVYVAYAIIVAHVALGYLQTETSPILAATMGAGLLWIVGLHLYAGAAEAKMDRDHDGSIDDQGFVEICGVDEIPEKRGRIAFLSGDRVAVFRYDGKISAISNACQHQNGPLGEGRVIDGYVTCPWHGFQYDPATGASPPPFAEKVPTFNVRVHEGRIWVHPTPNRAGTYVKPAHADETGDRP